MVCPTDCCEKIVWSTNIPPKREVIPIPEKNGAGYLKKVLNLATLGSYMYIYNMWALLARKKFSMYVYLLMIMASRLVYYTVRQIEINTKTSATIQNPLIKD